MGKLTKNSNGTNYCAGCKSIVILFDDDVHICDADFEFEHVFTVDDMGRVTDAEGIYAPAVWHSDTDDVEIEGDDWEPLTGWTRQDGYRGAVMHASEQFAGSLRDWVLENPGTYVLVVVEVMPEDDEDWDVEPAGWAVLRYVD